MFNIYKRPNEEVKFPESFSEVNFSIGTVMMECFNKIEVETSTLPIKNEKFGINDFIATKLPNSYYDKVTAIGHPIYSFKHISKEFKSWNLNENNAIIEVISLGLDNKVWKFTIKTFFTSTCYCKEFNSRFNEFCLLIANAFITDFNLNCIIHKDYQIDLSEEIFNSRDMITNKHFEGSVKTYSNSDELLSSNLDEIINPSNYNSSVDSIIESAMESNEKSLDDYIQNNCTIADIIRDNTPEMVIRSTILKIVTDDGQPTSWFKQGDEYLDIELATTDENGEYYHIYINIKDVFNDKLHNCFIDLPGMTKRIMNNV